MTIHQCPKCELRYSWKTELDDHIWHDHPDFRHEYPVWSAHHPAPQRGRAEEQRPAERQ